MTTEIDELDEIKISGEWDGKRKPWTDKKLAAARSRGNKPKWMRQLQTAKATAAKKKAKVTT